MKLHNYTKAALALIAGAFALLSAPCQAAANYYHVSIDTSSLIGASEAPFFLDFQLNGGGPLSNTAIIFNFAGGSTVPAAFPVTFGLASGDLDSGISLTADTSSAFNELFQQFTPGNVLQFDLSLTSNVNTPTPDAFAFSLLDKNFQSIPTNGLGDSLLMIDISDSTPVAHTFSSPLGIAAAVPEPGTLLFGFALVGVCGATRRGRTC
jgi:hypothetical protein